MRIRISLIATLALLAATSLAAAASYNTSRGMHPDDFPFAPAVQPAGTAHRLGLAASVKSNGGGREKDVWILHLADPPLATYCGGNEELPATCPEATGTVKLNPDSPASRLYLEHLTNEHRKVQLAIEEIIGHPLVVIYHYQFAFNGMSVKMTDPEAEKVKAAHVDSVVVVEPGVIEGLLTDDGPAWIGATAIWNGLDGLPGTKGEGVVAGIIDTGINIDHPSFAATGGDGYVATNPKGKYYGWCNASHPKHKAHMVCNDKLIGMYSFTSDQDPEDGDGHGSHTSSTVAGNVLPAAVLHAPTSAITRSISGVAPHANVIMYEACVENPLPGESGGCPSSATTAAIDQATADGVDSLNYSISSGQNSPWINSRFVAFRGAVAAGVFVAVSAGNAGPGAQTTNAGAPWITAVAAMTHDRKMLNRLINMTGGGSTPPPDMDGASFTAGYGPAKIVYAAGISNTLATDDGRCLQPFPAGTWNGEIVVCDRGSNARVAKATNVMAGGAGGMVLANDANSGASLSADGYDLPGVHITYANAVTLKNWLKTGTGHMGTIMGTIAEEKPAYGDSMAAFSSRGSALTAVCCRRPGLDIDNTWLDLIKPDIGAPGVDILAAVASDPSDTSGEPEFGLLSGTSMSGPHVAGAGTLVRALRPTWTVPQMQSAMMMTGAVAGTKKEDGSSPTTPFDVGAGRVNLAEAGKSGLLMSIPSADYMGADPDKGGNVSSLNRASLANAQCLKICTWTRTVENARNAAVNWTVSITPIPGQAALAAGLTLTVNPTTFSLPAGGKQTIQVTADVSGLALDTWAFAHVVLTPADTTIPTAHWPVAIQRVGSKLPPFVTIETDQTTGSKTVSGLQVNGATQLTLTRFGLAKGTTGTGSAEPDPTNTNPYDLLTTSVRIPITLDAGVKRVVVETTASSAPDIDMFVVRDANGDGNITANEVICTSGSETWQELCELLDPPPGDYIVYLQNFTGSGAASDSISYAYGIVPGTDAGNWTASGPAAPADGALFDLQLGWNIPTLAPNDRYFGVLGVGSAADKPGDLGFIMVDLLSTMKSTAPTATPPTVPTTVPPTAVPPTTVPPTAVPPTVPAATATPAGKVSCICSLIRGRVPEQAINYGAANPEMINGWGKLAFPNLPPGPRNGVRSCLSITNPAIPYHPVNNGLIFRSGCP